MSVRGAEPAPADAQGVLDIQLACVPITLLELRKNATTISNDSVFIAEIERVPVGFALTVFSNRHDPLFAQVVAVAPAVANQ